MADDIQLQEWWNELTEDQQRRLKQAVQTYPADPSIPELLLSTGCPAKTSWAATSWPSTGNPPAITLHDPVAKFIENKINDE